MSQASGLRCGCRHGALIAAPSSVAASIAAADWRVLGRAWARDADDGGGDPRLQLLPDAAAPDGDGGMQSPTVPISRTLSLGGAALGGSATAAAAGVGGGTSTPALRRTSSFRSLESTPRNIGRHSHDFEDVEEGWGAAGSRGDRGGGGGGGSRSAASGGGGAGGLALRRQERAVAAGAAYCTASCCMILLNKLVLSGFQWEAQVSLMLYQNIVTVVLVSGLGKAGFVDLEPLSWQLLRAWLPVNLIFVGMLITSFYSLKYMQVAMVTILKNTTNIMTAVGEMYLFNKRHSTQVWLSLSLMIVSALFGGITDLSFHPVGYGWQLLNCLFTAAYALTLRRVMDTAKVTTKSGTLGEMSMVLLNNSLSLPLGAALMLAFGEVQYVYQSPLTKQGAFWFATTLSGLLGLFISFSSMWFLHQTSPTTYSLVGSLNKIPLSIAGILLFQAPTSTANLASIFFGLFAGVRRDEDGGDGGDGGSGEEAEEKRRRRRRRQRERRDASPGTGSESGGSGDESTGSSDGGGDGGGDHRKRRGRRISKEELEEYLARKMQKKALKLAKRMKQQSVSGYTNDNNPFGDANLTEKFVWRKKIDKDLLTGNLDTRELSLKAEKRRQVEREVEIEKVRKRREEREMEKAQHEEEMNMLARERAKAEFMDWEKKEDEFHFEQAKVRANIRLREGRAKPIDVLSKNLNLADDFDIEINEPYTIFKGLTVPEMGELMEDIRMHLELDRSTPIHIEFWESMLKICEYEIAEATKRDVLDRARVRGEEPLAEYLAEERGLHASVDEDVKSMLLGKTSPELSDLERQIVRQMESGTAKVVEYWEAVLKRLQIFKAKARLKEIHTDLLRQHLAKLQDTADRELEQRDHKDKAAPKAKKEWDEADEDDEVPPAHEEADEGGVQEPGSFSPELLGVEDAAKEAADENGNLSPELLHSLEGDEVVDPEADRAELEQKRAKVLAAQQLRLQEAAAAPDIADGDAEAVPLTNTEKAQAIKAMGGLDAADVTLGPGAEVNLESQVYWWHDKYRPRKPKYFNRVHTGYEWNKYNQTHYDHDNPPPKIVQGYKFNIFYPDLIDKTKAPMYVIDCDGSKHGETCLIRFHAGPPYEDIAFRIVNKEWEYSHKKGYKCTFERGILHVYFNFKRYRYRR
eukprot:SM000104S09347  [mRNA]  locus=s104:256169:264320:+ [translate_table: standard]